LELSETQILFYNYLKKVIGFKEDAFSESFFEFFSSVFWIHEKLVWIKNDNSQNYFSNSYYKESYNKKFLVPHQLTPIDILNYEKNLKINRDFKFKDQNWKYVSATDLASLVFCPVSYSIIKTFETDDNILSERGTELHEKSCIKVLIKKELSSDLQFNESFSDFIKEIKNESNKFFFDDVFSSEMVYSGHNDELKKQNYFINKQYGFVGQPDFILKNSSNENYVIEEKYKFVKNIYDNKFLDTPFWDNHKVQLASYISLLDEYKLKYGYLVYWFYHQIEIPEVNLLSGWNYYSNREKVIGCKVLKIENTGKVKEYILSKLDIIRKFQEAKHVKFNPNSTNPKKCVSCMQFSLCGHKTRNYDTLTLPYNEKYLRLFSAELPEGLKKEK
jgi:CRISPR/Cas system-associated exonuclease Cas4 (RecB family)